MNHNSCPIRLLYSGSIFYHIHSSHIYHIIAMNKVRQTSNYVKYAYGSYRLLARAPSKLLIRSFPPIKLYQVDKIPNYFTSSSFHLQRITNKEYSKTKNSEDKGKNDEKEIPMNEDDHYKNLSLVQKFKLMYKRYWYVLLPVHVATSIVWYGTFFFAAKSGIDIIPLLEKLGTTEKFLSYLRNSDAGYYGIAYAMYKLATPARYTVTLGGTTISINYLIHKGYIKPVPTREELKVMYEDRKEELKEKTDEMKEKYQEKKEEFIERYQDKTGEMREKYQERKTEFMEKYTIGKSKSDEKPRR